MHTTEEFPVRRSDDSTLSQLEFQEALTWSRAGFNPGRAWQKFHLWRYEIARFGVLLLPSFLHEFVSPSISRSGEASSTLHYERLTGCSRHNTSFLDGMRGCAAFGVFLEHFLIPFWDKIFYAYGGHEDTNIFQSSIVRLSHSGSPMVCIFFVISGVALSLRPAQLIRKGEWELLYRTLESMVFRRGIRLFAPALLISFALMLAAHWHLCDVQAAVDYEGPAEILDEFWDKQPRHVAGFWSQGKEWLSFVTAKLLMPSTWRATTTGHDYGDLEHVEYGSQLWTVSVEYWSSILLFITLLGSARLPNLIRLPLFAALALFSLTIGRWDMALFLYGSILASTPAFRPDAEPKKRPVLYNLAFVPMLALGLHLASFPELGGSHTPLFAWLTPITTNSRTWQSFGAALIVSAVSQMGILRQMFSCTPLLYLGRISYGLYLVHIPLLVTFGWRIVPIMWELTGREESWDYTFGLLLSFLIILAMTVWLADLSCRLLDEPCTSGARKLEAYLLMSHS